MRPVKFKRTPDSNFNNKLSKVRSESGSLKPPFLVAFFRSSVVDGEDVSEEKRHTVSQTRRRSFQPQFRPKRNLSAGWDGLKKQASTQALEVSRAKKIMTGTRMSNV